MPSFSFTAPIVTAEEEKKEREELEQTEYQSVLNDMTGVCCDCEKDSEDVSFSTSDFHKELAENVSPRDKTEILEAMMYVPHLVATESNPRSYSRSHPLAENAARCASQYWKHRLKLFGGSRAFLPMTLEAAMAEDVSTLHKGFFTVLPKDRAGRAVIFFDRIRAIPTVASREAVCRALFYILQKVTEDESVREKGFVFVENIVGYDLYTHFDRILTKTIMSLLRDCFPSLLRCYHVCAGNTGKWAVDLIMPVIKQISGKSIRLRTVCHMANSSETLAIMDRTYNLEPNSQSVIIGGEVSYAHQLVWIHDHMTRELDATMSSSSNYPARDGNIPYPAHMMFKLPRSDSMSRQRGSFATSSRPGSRSPVLRRGFVATDKKGSATTAA